MASWTEQTIQDLRFSLRSWRRAPAFSLTAVATLALGIGANAAIFSVVSGVLLRPLPFPEPDRLVQLKVSSPADARLPPFYVTAGDLAVWRERATSLERASTYSVFGQTLERVDVPEQVSTVRVDRSFFPTLGAEPMIGRVFHDDDPPNVVVASFGFWTRHLGADRSAIGREITLDGERFVVVGVMGEEFQFPYSATRTDVWTAWTPRADPRSRLDAAIGRLRSGVTLDTARTELTTLSGQLAPGRRAHVTRLADVVSGPARDSLLVLLGAVGLVLLVACANVANLLLARSAARAREVAVRAALGAGRVRLVRQFLTESLLLAFIGGALGMVIGKLAAGALVARAAADIPRAWEIGFDWRVFAFLLIVCVVTGVGFGIAPALGTVRRSVHADLKPGERGSAARGRLRDVLVIAEIALAFMLLTGAGLLLRTFLNLTNTPTGFNSTGVLTLHMVVANADESRALEQRVTRIPGVQAVGFISLLPLQQSDWYGNFSITGRSATGSAEFRYVTPGYFAAMGIPIRSGRALTDGDTANAPKALLVNEALARKYFPDGDAVGRELTDRGTIVGVVGDVRQVRLERAAVPEIYYPVAQNFAQLRSAGSSMVVRSPLAADGLIATIRAALREVNPNLATFRVQPLDLVIGQSLGARKLYLLLLGIFATMATLLAAAGIYGVVAYLVTLRTREFGIRIALGADKKRVLGLVVGHGGALVAGGITIGAAGALALTRLLTSVLYGVTATDLPTFIATSFVLSAAALGACVIPARRAARVDPAVALRAE